MQKNIKAILLAYGIPLVGLLIYWYFSLTPITFQSLEFWMNVFAYLAVSAFLLTILSKKDQKPWKTVRLNAIIAGIGFLVLIVGSVIGLPIFRSGSYADLITYEEGNFEQDLHTFRPNEIPTIDRDMAERLGSRKIGEVLDLVSQFNVANEYTQIAFNDQSLRVSPLEYVNVWRWFTNRSEGIPHYVTVDMVTGESELVDLEETIRYSHSGFLNDDITRHIFLHYPTTMFETPAFEIDEEGKPLYIAPIVTRRFSFLGPKDVVGAFVVDATNGEIKRYDLDEIPDWVDRVFPADMVMNQINYNGQYQNGFWNSLVTKRGVIQNAEGYNYVVLDNDLYLYTGLTSVASDESNIGFVLVNSRTKEARRFNISTATEWSAMESAEGSVQEKEYISTFPLLFNMNGNPVYQLSLKDSAGLIKLYAFVDALNYQRVGIGESLSIAWTKYSGETAQEANKEDPVGEIESIEGTVSLLQPVVVDGETTYYFTIEGSENIYIARVSLNNSLPFLTVGDQVQMEVRGNTVESIEISN